MATVPRRATARARGLAGRVRSTFERERHHGEAEWTEWISGSGETTNRVFAAREDDEWLGIAVGSRTRDESTAYVYSMWVDPSVRRVGLGHLLLDAVVDWARSIGATALELNVSRSNPGAIAFYERMGFVDTTERRPLREGSTQDVMVMRRGVASSL
jgi:ribosomal protein S18 acetylase RimI-like enzyme